MQSKKSRPSKDTSILTFMAAASATNIVAPTFGYKFTWNFFLRNKVPVNHYAVIMKLTDEMMSQPADLKAADRVYS